MTTCDADRVLAALTGRPEVNHSDDVIEIWHGMDTPAYACGMHSTGLALLNVFRGHRARLGQEVIVSVVTHNGENDREVTVPTPDDKRQAYVKSRTGYSPEDTPSQPRRSAYTDDATGTGAYLRAIQRWELYSALIDS